MAQRARALYADSLVWDDHSGFMPEPGADLGKLSVWRDAGVGYLSINVGFDVMDWRQTIKTLAAFRNWIDTSEHYRLVSRAADIEAARRAGKMAVTFDLEGMNALDGSVDMVSFYYALGVRQMLVAYNRNNQAGGGCHDTDAGLTAFGRAVIAEMNRVGMLIDCSHCSYQTSMEAMELSRAPVIFSHSNARVLHDHERNIRDEQARACAATGGVIGIVGLDAFLTKGVATASTMADHIDHFVDLVGPAHVGLGLDYDWDSDSQDTAATVSANADYWPVSQYPGSRSLSCLPPSCYH